MEEVRKGKDYMFDRMGEALMIEQQHELTEFVSEIPRRITLYYDIVIDACSDPTFWPQTKDLMRQLGHRTYFPIRQLSR